MGKNETKGQERQIELLEILSIVLMARFGVPQNTIKKIVRVSTNKVNEIAKHISAKE